jgi:carboxymethylenebutenolidase
MQIDGSDGAFSAYLARPQRDPAPVVVVLQEIFGVNTDIRATCDELAGQGFLAIAPDLFWRDAPGLDLSCFREEDWKRGLALYESFDLDRGVRDIAATIAAARHLPGSSGWVAAMGYCLGGLMAFLTSARTDVDASVAYYGGNTDRHLDEAEAITGPLLMHLGEEDEFISKDAQGRIKAALRHRPAAQIYSYKGCSHAFARHSGVHFDAAAAALANERTYAFLQRHLAGG